LHLNFYHFSDFLVVLHNFYKKENTLSQMRGRFVARVCGGDKSPEENLSIKKNWSALQSAPFKSAKITGFLILFS